MKKPIILFFLILFSSKIFSQVIGGTRNDEITPKTLQAGKLSKGSYNGNVNLFSGEYNASYPIGTVATPCGLSYTLSYNYSSSFIVGGTPSVGASIPYGEGWSLNLPTITVNTDVYKVFSHLQYCNETVETYPDGEKIKEGDLYWYGPEINIPGVANGRAVFKYMEVGTAVFVLNEFESPVTIKFTGSDWYVQLEDGTMYIFDVAMHDIRSPSNARTLNYEYNENESAVTGENNAVLSNFINGAGYDTGLPSHVLKAILPHEGFSSWYCGRIINQNYPLQSILFEYETFGARNYFKEFQQSAYGKAVNLTSDFYTLEYNPDFTSYSDILLKNIYSFAAESPIDKVELQYETKTSLLGGGPFIDFRNDADASRLDSLYSTQKIVVNGGLNDFTGWKRYNHARLSPNPGNDISNATNPYIDGSIYRRQSVSSTDVSFNHSFLEAKKIPINDLNPGDIYEIKTKVTKPFSQSNIAIGTGTLDIAVLTGASPGNDSGSGDISKNDYDLSHQVEVFSTFNRALKWQFNHDENAINTSNLFVMPNIPNSFGNIYIQVGPGNSDTDFGMPGDMNFDLAADGSSMYHSLLSYSCFPYNQFFGPTNNIQHNFGVGLPWSNVLPLSKAMALGLIEAHDDKYSDLPYFDFWWQYEQQNGLPNIPTKFDNTVELKEFELIRHAKNPYMLKSVSTYHLNGEISDNGQGDGWKLTSKKIFKFLQKTESLYDKNIVGTDIELVYGGKSIVSLELASIEELPVNTDIDLYDPNKILRTSFGYESFIKVDFSSNPTPLYNFEMPNDGKKGSLLTKIVDHLGGITNIKYYPFDNPITSKSRLYQVENVCQQTPYETFDIDRPTMIYPVVEYIIENDEQNLNLNDATINPSSRKTYYEFDVNDKTGYSRDISFVTTNFYNSTTSSQKINPGFRKVNVYSNALATGEQNKTEYIHFSITDSDLNETERYLYAGKLRSVKEFDNTGKIHYEKLYKYGYVLAHENGYNRPLPVSKYLSKDERFYDRLVDDYEYKDYYRQQEEVVVYKHYEGIPPNVELIIDAEYTGDEAKKRLFPNPLYLSERPDFLEYEFFRDIESRVPIYKLNSYFVRLEEETERKYENYLYKNAITGGNTGGTGVPVGGNPFGVGKTGAGVSGLNETIISFIRDNKNTPIKIKERLIQETPLTDQVLNEVILTNRLTSNFKTDILLIQQGLTNETWKTLLTNEKSFSPKNLLDLITIQEYFADEIQLKAIEINHKNFDSKVFEGIFLKQGVISDIVRNSLLDATNVDKKSIAEIFRLQTNMSDQILIKLINSPNILSTLLPSILMNQNLSDDVYEVLILKQDLTSSDLATIIEQAKVYPSDDIISKTLQRSPRLEFNDFKRIVEKTEKGFGEDLALLTRVLLDEWFRGRDRIDIRVNENQVLLYCSNPTIQDWNYIETKTSYEYYEADFRGSTNGRAYKTLMALGDFPITIDLAEAGIYVSGERYRTIDKVYLKHEPSWQIFSKKTSSSHLPNAYQEEQFFYTYDLKNRYDRYWFNYDIVGNDSKSFAKKFTLDNDHIDTLGFIKYWGQYDDHSLDYVDFHTLPNWGSELFQPQFPKYDAIVKSIDKNLRNLPFQKTQISKNSNDIKPKKKSEYYHYNSRWEFDDQFSYTRREYDGPECPPVDPVETDPCSFCQEFKLLHDYTNVNINELESTVPIFSINGYDTYLPLNYCLWDIDNLHITICPSNCDFKEKNPYARAVICNDGRPNTGSGEYFPDKSISPLKALEGTLQLAQIFVQVDTLELNSSSDFQKYKMDRNNSDIMELYIGSFKIQPTDVEYKPILPFDVLMTSEINKRNNLLLPEIVTNQAGIKTKYYYNPSKLIWNANVNCDYYGNYATRLSVDLALPKRITIGFERPDSMATSYEYNDWGIVSKVTQSSGHFMEYNVDEYLRLKEVKENGTNIISSTTYNTWKKDPLLNFLDRTKENYVTNKLYNSYLHLNSNTIITDSGLYLLSRSYIDPLGRDAGTSNMYKKNPYNLINPLASQDLNYYNFYSGAIKYDAWDRIIESFNPTSISGPNQILGLVGSDVSSDKLIDKYEQTPKKRLIRKSDYGITIDNQHTTKIDYTITNYIFMTCELNLNRDEAKMIMSTPNIQSSFRFFRTLYEDQDSKQTIEYTNSFGQKVATLAYDDANQKIVTLFGYDSFGNLIKVINPEKQQSSYEYNLLGLLVREITVDAGEKRMMYNKHLKVSVIQDQLHRNMISSDGLDPKPLVRKFIFDDYGRLLIQKVQSISPIYNYLAYANVKISNSNNEPTSIDGNLVYFNYIYSYKSSLDWLYTYEIWNGLNIFETGPGTTFSLLANRGSDIFQNDKSTNGSRPIANDDSIIDDGSGYFGINVLDNDTDADGNNTIDLYSVDLDPFTPHRQIEKVTTEGTWTVYQEGLVIFVPNDNFTNGDAQCFYSIKDISGNESDPATIVVSLVGSNYVSLLEKKYEYGIDGLQSNVGKLLKSTSYKHTNTFPIEATPIQEIVYTYDQQDRIASQLITFDADNLFFPTNTKTAIINYPAYNLQGSILHETVDLNNDGTLDFQYFYAYDPMNRLNEVYISKQNSTTKTLIAKYSYENAFNKLVKEEQFYTNGQVCHNADYHYDIRQRLDNYNGDLLRYQLFYDDQIPSNSLVQSSQNYNGNINAFSIDYLLSHTNNPSGFNFGTTYGYNYDRLNRLVKADAYVGDFVVNAGNSMESYLIGDENYTYDRIGNLKTLQRHNKVNDGLTIAQLESFAYSYFSNTNKLSNILGLNGTASRAYTYDPNGNLLTDNSKQINQTTYGRASYPCYVTKGAENYTYLYDINDQRIFKEKATQTSLKQEYYLKDALGRDIALYDYQLNTWTSQVYGNKLEARIKPDDVAQAIKNTLDPGQILYFLYDYLGNTRVTYRAVEDPYTHSLTKQIEYAADYMPYGKLLRHYDGPQGQEKYLTTHHERDEETQLDYRGARYYDSDVARFLSVDPWANKYASWSTYNYCMGNPVNLIDPTGKGPTDWVKNIQTGEYIWDNTVTNQFQAHEGQKYIGKENSDIIKDLFGQTSFSANTWDAGTTGSDSGPGWVATSYAKIFTKLNVSIQANVSYNGDNRTFNGVDFFASAEGTTSAPLTPDKNMEFAATDVKFQGADMKPMGEYNGAVIKAQYGSGSYKHSWDAQRIYNDFGKSYNRTISLQGQYTFGGAPLLYSNLLPNPTSLSLTIPFNNK